MSCIIPTLYTVFVMVTNTVCLVLTNTVWYTDDVKNSANKTLFMSYLSKGVDIVTWYGSSLTETSNI